MSLRVLVVLHYELRLQNFFMFSHLRNALEQGSQTRGSYVAREGILYGPRRFLRKFQKINIYTSRSVVGWSVRPPQCSVTSRDTAPIASHLATKGAMQHRQYRVNLIEGGN